jgi:arginine/lysine/ornithine decarboxylase
MLHVQGNRVDRDKLRRHLSMLQSSSPSYPLLASLDLARRQLDADGPALFDESLAAIEQFCRAFDSLPGLERVRHQPGRSPYDTLDPYKLTIRDRRGVRSRSGYELQRQLERYGCYAEMADTVHLLLAWSLATSQDDCSRLLQALNRLMDSWDHDGDSRLSGPDQGLKGMETAISPIEWEASMERSVFSEPVQFSMNEIEGKAVPLSEAAGKISAEMVIPYPPGIPLLYPGERIGEHAVEVLSKLAEHNANVQGAADPRLRSIRVRI